MCTRKVTVGTLLLMRVSVLHVEITEGKISAVTDARPALKMGIYSYSPEIGMRCLSTSPKSKSCEMEPKVSISINVDVRSTQDLKRQIMNYRASVSGAGNP